MNGLEFGYGRRGGVREPGRGGVGEKGSNKGFIGKEEGFFMLASDGSSQGSDNVEAGGSSLDEGVDMGRESKVGVEGDTEDAGITFKGEKAIKL